MFAATPKLGIHRSTPAVSSVSDASRPETTALPMRLRLVVLTLNASGLLTARIALMK